MAPATPVEHQWQVVYKYTCMALGTIIPNTFMLASAKANNVELVKFITAAALFH
jgi:hypothetical protein